MNQDVENPYYTIWGRSIVNLDIKRLRYEHQVVTVFSSHFSDLGLYKIANYLEIFKYDGCIKNQLVYS